MKSILNWLLHLGMTMSRRSSGGGDGIAVDGSQSFGPEVLFCEGCVSSDFCVVWDLFGHVRQLQKDCKA